MASPNPIYDIFSIFLDPAVAFPLVSIVVILLLFSGEGSRPKLAFAYWAGKKEQLSALNIAMKQLQERKRDKVTLYLGTPKSRIHLNPVPRSLPLKEQFKLRYQNFKIVSTVRSQVMMGNPPTYFLTNCERGVLGCGSPGSGKTKTLTDQFMRSCMDEGLSLVVFDVKGELLRRHAAYAAANGYEVHVFAPGFPYSGCINILDFLRDEGDAAMAREIAHIINRNAKAHSSKSDDFFGPAGDQLVELILMMAKGSLYPDLLMAWKILSLPKLAKRLQTASSNFELDLWAEVSATSIMSVADAERTVSGIVGAAVNTFSGFVKRDFLSSLVGQTTIPLKLDGKQILFFQTDETKESVITPLLAAMMHMVIKHNMNNKIRRDRPLAAIFEEFSAIYLPDVEIYINRFREYGMVTYLNYQNDAQLKEKYGEHKAESITAGCMTKAIFNPSHEPTAARWSKHFGEKEVVIKTRSRSFGKNYSNSQSEQYHKVPLMSAEEINGLPEGGFVLINGGYRSRRFGRKRIAVPLYVEQGKIPLSDSKAEENSVTLWDNKVRARLVRRVQKTQLVMDNQQLQVELLQRGEIADWMLPDAREVKAEQAAA